MAKSSYMQSGIAKVYSALTGEKNVCLFQEKP